MGRALREVLELEPQTVRFVNSLGLGREPSIEPERWRLARSPRVRFKLDEEASWSPALVDEVAETGSVDTIDFKGQYGFEVKDPEALGALYDRVLARSRTRTWRIWARLDSNQGATDYESAALTAELRARARSSVQRGSVLQRRCSYDCHNDAR